MSDLEVMCCYVAAAGHDYKHPGYNNIYCINTRNEIATFYNDRSVLENYHVSTLFKDILNLDGSILNSLSRSDFSQCR